MSKEHWGSGAVYWRGKRLWIRYPDGSGQQRRESAKTTDPEKARKLLERRLVEKEDDRLPAKSKERKLTIDKLLDHLLADLKARETRSADEVAYNLSRLRAAFGEQRAERSAKRI
jgi:hypothetical protein